jgi:hypothetical protein
MSNGSSVNVFVGKSCYYDIIGIYKYWNLYEANNWICVLKNYEFRNDEANLSTFSFIYFHGENYVLKEISVVYYF